MTTRRQVLVALSACAFIAPLSSIAQQQGSKVARIGLLEADSISKNRRDALIAGLREHGLVEGKNMVIEYRHADGRYERLPALAAELVQTKPDLIVAASSPAIRAALKATATIPVVMLRPSDPVVAGFVDSLAKPGRNITGLSNVAIDISGKYLELLREAVPTLSRVSVLVDPNSSLHPALLKALQALEKTSGMKISEVRAATPADVEAAFATLKQERPGALIVLGNPFFATYGRRIAELAMQQRLPTLFSTQERVEAGGLMSYGVSDAEQYRRVGTYVDKILKGARPAELPVEQPTKLELVINLKTAKSIGLTIPQQLLLRADRVIE